MNNQMDKVNFQNQEYPVRSIELPALGNVLISTIDLNSLLLNVNGAYTSDEALYIDEKIYYYVERNEIGISVENLIKLLPI